MISREPSNEDIEHSKSKVDLQATMKLYTSKSKQTSKKTLKKYRSKKDSILNTKKRGEAPSYYAM